MTEVKFGAERIDEDEGDWWIIVISFIGGPFGRFELRSDKAVHTEAHAKEICEIMYSILTSKQNHLNVKIGNKNIGNDDMN